MSRSNPTTTPPIELLLDRVESRFLLVALAARRAREINNYYNQLGEGLGKTVPPQVTSEARKSLTIAFEEVAAGKITYERIDPSELEAGAELAESGDAVDVTDDSA